MRALRPRHAGRQAKYSLWSVAMVLIGLFLIPYSFFVMRDAMPPQVEPFIIEETIAPAEKVSPVKKVVTEPEDINLLAEKIRYVPYPERGDLIGTITFPSLDSTWPIYQGTRTFQLDKGVGHHVKSVLPGQKDNAVLAGHRETVFNKLGDLELGDLITVSTTAGTFDYKIRKFRVVPRSDRTVIVPTDTAVLTLITCYPINYIGTTNRSFIVVADLVAIRPHY
jgi:sortase A